jgi:ubiquinone/menaquinone biosynthesis C-methylase UbiE
MTATADTAPRLASRLVNGVLSIKPLANLAKQQARKMMIKRAESIGVYWTKEVQALRSRGEVVDFSSNWEAELAQVQNSDLTYPEYYLRPFHAYDQGDLSWDAAMEAEVAAHAVHARIWPEAGAQGDTRLRQSYHDILKAQISNDPKNVLDLGCSVGMSTFALQEVYPQATITGLDLSPYFLAIAHYRSQQQQTQISWIHAAAESTGLPDASFDLISAFLVCHELPRTVTKQIFQEAYRLLRPNGHLAIMDMNPKSEVHAKMPPYILTLLKSTEPYLDDYFTFDIEQAFVDTGFTQPSLTCNSPRHRTLVAQVSE